MRPSSLAWVSLAIAASACAPHVVGNRTGHFVSDEAIQNVKVCETRGDEVLATFGEPNGRGRDNELTTLQWIAMIGATDGVRAAVRSQTIQVWVDRSGRVAGIVVNPATMPTTPTACPTGDAPKTAAGKPDKSGASKAKAR